ncbi:MAG: DegT/DnrJ/EryC1/StrS family aminotransferase [Patescibacteria group bacterium]
MIPLFPTLHPAYFRQPAQPSSLLPFPLNQKRVRYYYFARNGIWEALQIFGLKTGDEVLMPAFTSGIEVDAVIASGLVPVIYDLHENFTPNFNDVRAKLSPRTKILYLTHYLGFPQLTRDALNVCKNNGLYLFEDVAIGFLSADEDGEPLGSKGDAAIFCPRKTVPIPHGGLMVVNNPDLPFPATRQRRPSHYSTARQMAALSLKRMAASKNSRAFALFGSWTWTRAVPLLNAFLKTIGIKNTECGRFEFDATKTDWGMSAISKYLLPRFDYEDIKHRHRENYTALAASIKGVPGLTIAFSSLPAHTVPLDLMILGCKCNEINAKLRQQGIETSVFWPDHRSYEIGDSSPFIKKILREHLVLPIHQDLSTSDMEIMGSAIRRICLS